jgi:predicted ABC-type ATPase
LRPVLLVIAGPNGSGKTTLTERLRVDRWSENVEYLNPDEIAQARFGDWNSPDAVRAAADFAAERRESLLAAGLGIAFETVFSAPDKVDFLIRAKQAGYFIRLFFVGTEHPRINAARVAERVMQGGHTVPIDKIVTRYQRSMGNLAAGVRLADRAYLYDNSIDREDARLCARTHDGALRKMYGVLPRWSEHVLSGLPRHPDFADLR